MPAISESAGWGPASWWPRSNFAGCKDTNRFPSFSENWKRWFLPRRRLSNAGRRRRVSYARAATFNGKSGDPLRPLGPNQWAIHVPLGKLKTERWVPVDSMVCQLVERIRSLRPPTAPNNGRLLLLRPRGRIALVRRIRAALQDVVTAVGIPARIVPHQFRHTYGTEMLRAAVG